MFTDRTALGGTPIGVAGDIVMRNAESCADAQKILEEHRPIGCWTYLVADGRRREALCYEENPERRAPRKIERDSFGYANIYLDEELGRSEVNLYGSYWRHNLGRHQRVNAMLDERRGSIDPQAMAEMIGDTGSGGCRIRDSIAMVMTVASVVFRPEDGTLWMGTGEAPTSHGTYLPFSLSEQGYAPERGSLSVPGGSASSREAFESFRKAYVAYLDRGDVRDAHRHAREATQRADEQTIYFMVRGLFAIELGEAEDAERSFDRALELGHPDVERISSLHLWRARARDLNGRRDAAVADYRACLGRAADPPVHVAAKRGLTKPFTARAARRTHVDVAFGDVVSP
jgi:tetratricopeptide (TPR) repeat protein